MSPQNLYSTAHQAVILTELCCLQINTAISADIATADWSFLRRPRDIEALIRKVAKDNHVKVSDIANSGDHIHCLIQIHSSRTNFRFIRSLTGLLARMTTGAERGSRLLEGFWTQKPFTRAISWGRELKGLHRYFQLKHRNSLDFFTSHFRSHSKSAVGCLGPK